MANNNKKNKDDNFLLYIPNKKHQFWEVRNGKVFLIFDHNKAAEKLVRWLVKKPNISEVELDEMGSKVWLYIDGKSSVYEIGKKLVEEFKGLKITRASMSFNVTLFMQTPLIRDLVKEKGVGVLPVTVIDGNIVKQQGYPKFTELSKWLKE
jgi:hypothetical protein